MMNIADIKHSIKSISETDQITRAMHLISTSKMKKAVGRYQANHAHFVRIQSELKNILMHTQELKHPYLGESEAKRAAYVVIAADKGLCGGYNHNVLNLAAEHMQNCKQRYIITIGQQARVFFDRIGYMVDIEFLHAANNPTLYNARAITRDILDLYDNRLMDEVYIVYTSFISVLRQEPQVVKLLPMSMANLVDVETELYHTTELFYHPSRKAVFDRLIPQYIVGLTYGCLVQSFASEQCARMNAMENATKNADEMISKLSLRYNSARQSAITEEITEIMGALETLK